MEITVADILNTRASFLVLLALGNSAKHGYEIAAAIHKESLGLFTVSFGNLYPILHKFEKMGFVTAEWQEGGETKSRKVYSLTAKGISEMNTEIENFKAGVIAFNAMIGKAQDV